jgi:hypothetical protein
MNKRIAKINKILSKHQKRDKMTKSITSIFTASTLAIFLLSACTDYKEALKVLPNELAIADDCKNTNKQFELDCYDLISYKNTFAQLRLGIEAQTKGNQQEAYHRYTLAQEKGNFYANALLADLYNRNSEIKDKEKKVLDLLKAVDEVDPIAAYKLSFHYLNKKDYDEVISLLTFAATNNVKKAQYELYKIYSDGEITKMDTDKSRYWYEQYEDKTNSFIRKIYGI